MGQINLLKTNSPQIPQSGKAGIFIDLTNAPILILSDGTEIPLGGTTLEQIYIDAINGGQNPSSENPFVTLEQLNSQVSGGINTVLFGGTVQWSGTGLVFDASPSGYVIEGVYYEIVATQLTLTAADGTNPRRDRFKLTTSGWSFNTGTPAAVPVAPTVNAITEIDRGDVLIAALATTPTVTNENVYLENTEWVTSSGGTGTFDPNSTTSPFAGTKAFEATNVQAGGFMLFTKSVDFAVSNIESIGLQLKLKATMNNGRTIRLQFLDSIDAPVSQSIALPIDKSNTTTYQFVALNKTELSFVAANVRKVRLVYSGTGGPTSFTGFFVDNVIIQTGVGQGSNIIFTQNEIDAIKSANAPTGSNYFVTLADLGGGGLPNGGTIGQVLTKNSATDGDASWKFRSQIVYNVEDYGAVHNGVTDDTVAIQAAINAAFAAGGGRVNFPKGIYIIGGALQTSVGGINYNSQIYIPQADLSNTNRTTIELVGEFQPNLLRSLGISTTIDPNSGVVLRSTIQGSGVEPAVIKNKGATANFNGISYTSLQVKNISIQLTPNGSNKITMGGIDCFNSAIANFEYVTCFPFNLNLVNSAIPDVIDVTGIAMPKAATEHINTISKCTVGGFTNGYKVGEHGSCYDAIAVCCVNAFLISQNNHLPNLVKCLATWCINQITIGTTAPGFPNGGYSFLCTNLGVEWRSAGSWYDTVSTIKDTLNYGRGKMVFDIVEANVGINNEKFKKDGGSNIKCEPITVNITPQITTTPYTLKYTDAFRKNKMNMATAQVITIPAFSAVTFDIDQEIVIQRLGAGDVTIQGAAGVTLNIPTGFLAKVKSQYDAVSIVQVAVNEWVIYGALAPTP